MVPVLAQATSEEGADGADGAEIKAEIDGREYTFPLLLLNDSFYFPARELFEALGTAVSWDKEAKAVIGTRGRVAVFAPVGSKQVKVNGKPVELETPVETINGMSLVPLSIVTEAFGDEVTLDKETSTVKIKTRVKPKEDALPERGNDEAGKSMVYRYKFMGDNLKVRIKLPEKVQMKESWSYVASYIGIDYSWRSQDGVQKLNAVEGGVSLRCDDTSNWYPFLNFYPHKYHTPYNDPEPWKGKEPIKGDTVTLEIKAGKPEYIGSSRRLPVDLYVNGEKVATRPLYAGEGQLEVKVCVSAYMSTGNENEISFEPFQIEVLEGGEPAKNNTENRMFETREVLQVGLPE